MDNMLVILMVMMGGIFFLLLTNKKDNSDIENIVREQLDLIVKETSDGHNRLFEHSDFYSLLKKLQVENSKVNEEINSLNNKIREIEFIIDEDNILSEEEVIDIIKEVVEQLDDFKYIKLHPYYKRYFGSDNYYIESGAFRKQTGLMNVLLHNCQQKYIYKDVLLKDEIFVPSGSINYNEYPIGYKYYEQDAVHIEFLDWDSIYHVVVDDGVLRY